MVGAIDWLASYPKSGNTWMRMLLANYFGESDQPHDINKAGVTNGIAALRWRFDTYMGVGSSDLTDDEAMGLLPHVFIQLARASDNHQWIKVHDAQARLPDGRWLFPPEATGCVVYLVRNPLDVAVSLAFHDGHDDMARAVEMLCDQQARIAGGANAQLRQVLRDWSGHVRSWMDQDSMAALSVRYEDLLEDAARELRRVISFARPDDPIDPARIEAAVAHADFGALQAAERNNGFREASSRQRRFFRSGKAGDWRNHLTPLQVTQIRTAHHETMDRFGYGDTV